MQRRKLLEVARERRELLSSKELGGNTYSLIMEDGFIDYEDRVCFQDLRDNDAHPIFIVNMVRTRVGKKLSLAFIEWWVGESFAAKAFVTKNAETILEKGAILDCSYPAHYVVLSMIGLRYLWEFPQIVRNWGMFEEHINADAAIIMAHMFSTSDGKVWEGKFSSENSNHTWFQNYWDKNEFTKAINHDLSDMSSLSPMTEDLMYNPMFSVFGRKAVPCYQDHPSLLYPPSNKTKEIISTFDYRVIRTVPIYEKENVKEWLEETYSLNYLKEGNKNES